MSSVRLFVLGTLARNGPMHGHQIRRHAQVDRTELWTDIKVGSLYSALHRLEVEGIIVALRSEQVGNRPERTVYKITEAGKAELAELRDAVFKATDLPVAKVDLALQYAADLPVEGLRTIFESRAAALRSQLSAWHEQWREAEPHLVGLEALTFAHTALRLEAEIAWHVQVLEKLNGSAVKRGSRKARR
jgi:DNA-binding PadR family transcriptional regulator